MFTERRIHKRVKKSIFFRRPPFFLKEQRSLDASVGGLLMESTRFYELNDKLRLELLIPKEKSIHCEAKIVWIFPKVAGASLYKVGLQFLNMPLQDEKRLRKFIY